jgi:hypothetical protein
MRDAKECECRFWAFHERGDAHSSGHHINCHELMADRPVLILTTTMGGTIPFVGKDGPKVVPRG